MLSECSSPAPLCARTFKSCDRSKIKKPIKFKKLGMPKLKFTNRKRQNRRHDLDVVNAVVEADADTLVMEQLDKNGDEAIVPQEIDIDIDEQNGSSSSQNA